MAFLRADRLASLYVFHPVQRLKLGRAGIPILMYHSISDAPASGRHPYYQTTTTPNVFDQHLAFLRENQYDVVDLNEVVKAGSETRKIAAITFDDGFTDFYTDAFPILNRYGFSATVFLPTAYIGDGAARQFNGIECMRWSQVRELHRAGIRFGSHTVNHPQLKTLQPDEVRQEIRNSKDTIEERLSAPIQSFAYPYAFPETDHEFKQTLRTILEEAGYQNGVCTSIGRANPSDPRLFMKRLPVNSSDDRRLFRAKLEGGYDWLHAFQYAAKVARGRGPIEGRKPAATG